MNKEEIKESLLKKYLKIRMNELVDNFQELNICFSDMSNKLEYEEKVLKSFLDWLLINEIIKR